MSQIRMDSENIAEIRNALTIIQLNAEQVKRMKYLGHPQLDEIINKVKQIDKLLPDVKFEGGKQCQQ